MYKITVQNLIGNETTIYYPGDMNYVVSSAVLTYEVGLAGEFNFTIPVINPAYDLIVRNAIITVYEDNKEIWRGDIRDIKTNFDKSLSVYVVEDLAWLGEEPTAMVSVTNESYSQRFSAVITAYNSNQTTKRQFTVGQLTAQSSSGTCIWQPEYGDSVLSGLRKFIAKDNGYLKVRRAYSGDILTRYIDIVTLADYGKQSTQKVEFGSNLIDFVKDMDVTNLCNALYPYGAETETELYGDLMQRIAGTPIQNNDSISAFGRRAKTVVFDTDNTTTLNNLASAYLSRYSQPTLTLEIKAADLGSISSVDTFAIGDSVRVLAKVYAVDQWMYITKMDVDLLDAAQNQITLCDSVRNVSLTSQVASQATEIKDLRSPASVLDAAKKNAWAILEGDNGGIVTFEVNGTEQIVGLHIANNLDLSQATEAWGWNINGLCYIHRQYPSDPWTIGIAMTMNGEIVADYITTGSMSANRVQTGLLTDQEGINYFNLDDGTCRWTGKTKLSLFSADYKGDYVPTNNNQPASGWTTVAEKEHNVGKTFYNTDTKDAYIYASADASTLPESAHPYADNTDQYFQINTEGIDYTKKLKINFNPSCRMEENYDYLIFYVYKNGVAKRCKLTNTSAVDFPSKLVLPARDDNRIFIWWHADSSNHDWGWKIDSFEEDPNDSAAQFEDQGFPIVTWQQYYYQCHWTLATLDSYSRNVSQMVVTENMTPEEVFNALTDNGRMQGIYQENGDLYINGTYIQSGIINADLIKAGAMSADRVAFGSMSANRLQGGTMIVGGLNNANGVLASVESVTWDASETSLAGGAAQIITVSSLAYQALWLRVTSSGKTTGEVVGQYQVNGGAIEDLRVGDTLIGAFQSETFVTIYAAYYALGFKKGLANVKTYVDNDGVVADNLVARNTGYIGDLHLENGELYHIGPFTLFERSKTKSSGRAINITNTSFRPAKLYIRRVDFQVGVTFRVNNNIDAQGYVVTVLQYYDTVNEYWATPQGCFIYTYAPEANTDYTILFPEEISSSDTKKWRVLVTLEPHNSISNTLTCNIYADAIRNVSISDEGYYGVFKGNHLGNANFDNLDTYDLDINDRNSDKVVYSDGSDLFYYDGSNIFRATWQSSSDRRIKEDIKPLDIELSRGFIDATRTKRFKYKNADGVHYGMIAQEARELLDKLGETESVLEFSQGDLNVEDQRAIQYDEYIPHLINYVKDLRAGLVALKEQVKLLKEDKDNG